MKILYSTDLHGSTYKFLDLKKIAFKEKVDIVLHGGDMLPKGKNFLKDQYHFIDWLYEYFKDFDIPNIIMPGNDDIGAYLNRFKKLSEVTNIIGVGDIVKFNGWEFLGYFCVPDNIFLMKDWNRLDREQKPVVSPYGNPVRSYKEGKYARFIEIDIEEYFKGKTIDKELMELPKPSDWSKTIFVSHAPPKKFGLGVVHDGIDYGSYSVTDFIEKKQPYLSFHGHIHESPDMSGVFCAGIGNTVCFQPGQRSHRLSYVIVDTDDVVGRLIYDV
jgi:Icc-related predicted phosphoesterase